MSDPKDQSTTEAASVPTAHSATDDPAKSEPQILPAEETASEGLGEGLAKADPEASSAEVTPAAPVEETLAARIALLEKEKAEARERMLRVAADFENWKKRARKDQADAEMRAKERVLKDFLEVVDNLERAASASTDIPQARAIIEGVQLVLRLFQSKFERHDVRPIESIGKPFDPHFHEAVARVPTADAAPGQIVQELVRGYRMGEQLLRPALVAVAVAPPKDEAASDGGQASDAPRSTEPLADGAPVGDAPRSTEPVADGG